MTLKLAALTASFGLAVIAGAACAQELAGLPAPVVNGRVWQPNPGMRWQIQYTARPVDTRVAADVFTIDLFDNKEHDVARLKRLGKRVVCYINAGAWEDWRPDAKRFPPRVLGAAYEGWPGERWLDIRRTSELAPVMLARLDLCRDRGFDGVLFDNVDLHIQKTGFQLTAFDQLRYIVWLANEARARGLAVGINNNPEQAVQLVPYVDWAQAESCFAQGWCAALRPLAEAGKPVVVIEYTEDPQQLGTLCREASALRFALIVKKRELDAFRRDCGAA